MAGVRLVHSADVAPPGVATPGVHEVVSAAALVIEVALDQVRGSPRFVFPATLDEVVGVSEAAATEGLVEAFEVPTLLASPVGVAAAEIFRVNRTTALCHGTLPGFLFYAF